MKESLTRDLKGKVTRQLAKFIIPGGALFDCQNLRLETAALPGESGILAAGDWAGYSSRILD